jgi:hypothetical protein
MKAFQELGCLFGERARRTECYFDMEDIAMLLFYLPIIIFEAMLETWVTPDAGLGMERPGGTEELDQPAAYEVRGRS